MPYSIEKDLQKILELEYHIPVTPSGRYTYCPGTLPVPERSVANTHAVSYKILAEIDVTKDAQGVIFAQSSRFGGHALFIKDGRLTYCYNFLCLPPEQRITAGVPTPGKHVVGVEFTKVKMGQYNEAHGPLKLNIDKVVAENEIRTMTGALLAVRRRAVRRLRQRGCGQRRVRADVCVYRWDDQESRL